MASTLLEQTREAHEECERLERFIVADLKTEAITHKQRLRQGHRVNRALDAIAANAKRLRATYADADSARAEELASFGTLDTNIVASDPNDDPNDAATRDAGTAFSSFYRRLEETRAYHASRPGMFAPPPDAFTRTFESDVPLTFSGEESNGRFLDMHAHHAAFRNATFGDPSVPYVAFLADVGVSQMRAIPRARKFGDAYSAYLESLRAYLAGFLEKVAPLRFSSHKREGADDEENVFDEEWRAGKCVGWEDRGVSSFGSQETEHTNASSDTGDHTLLSVGSVLEELRGASSLEEVSRRVRGDPEAVKARLAALSLKIGGTETQRLERLFEVTALASSVKNTETWPKGVPAKQLAKGSRVAAADPARAERRAKAVARLERAVAASLFELRGTLDATKAQVEKKQTLSAAELEAENEEDSDFVASESDDDDARDDPVNNPLRLPLGFDGKPIPYWLYKLHGLNLEFTCEICGNYSYWGRRAYERHFKEPRHQHGMRCLKIPNTKAFAEVRNTFLARRTVIARFRECPRRARFFSRGASRRAALETFFFFSLLRDGNRHSRVGHDGHTHWARTLLDDAHALGPRKPVT